MIMSTLCYVGKHVISLEHINLIPRQSVFDFTP